MISAEPNNEGDENVFRKSRLMMRSQENDATKISNPNPNHLEKDNAEVEY